MSQVECLQVRASLRYTIQQTCSEAKFRLVSLLESAFSYNNNIDGQTLTLSIIANAVFDILPSFSAFRGSQRFSSRGTIGTFSLF